MMRLMPPAKKLSGKLKEIRESVQTSTRLLKLIWQIDKWLFTGSFLAIIIPGLIPFINAYIYKLIIDLVVAIVSSGSVFNPTQFYPLLAARVVTFFFQELAFGTQAYMERLLWTKVPIELNQIILKKISGLDIHYFENDKFRDQLEKLRESYSYRPQRVVSNLFFGFQNVLEVIIAFIILIRLNWFFVILIVVVAVPYFINEAYRSKLAYGIWDAESSLKKRFHHLTHLLQHHREIKEVKMFKLAPDFLKQARALQMTFYQNNKDLAKKSYISTTFFDGLATMAFIGIEIYVIFEALAKRVTVGDVGFYTGTVSRFQNGLGGLLRNINQVFESSLYVKTIFEVLDAESIIKIKDDAIKLELSKPPVIEFKDVSFSYPETKTKILNNFTLKINPGEKIAFVGENGAGKSTIIKLLARFYDVDQGEILIDGINIKDLDLESWYDYFGVLFQDFNRYEDTVKDNIHYGKINQEFHLNKIISASKSGGAHQMIEKFDKQYEQMLGRMFEGGLELSGGQWQKIALSRAFYRNAPVLVLDEPTSAIDAKAEAEIFNKVEKLSKDKTVIIISHRFSTVRNADKIYVLDDGKITESGTHQDLMKKDGQYATLFKLQAKGYQ